jgi:hypothetical protein
MGGAWAQWRRPLPTQRIWLIFNEQSQQPDRIVATTRPFRAVKANLIPSYTVGPLAIGLRVDGLHYLDKQATTDTICRSVRLSP